MKRFKNVVVGTTTDFATVTVNGVTDLTLKPGVKLLAGMTFINEENGWIYKLSKLSTDYIWVRIDNDAAYGYNI